MKNEVLGKLVGNENCFCLKNVKDVRIRNVDCLEYKIIKLYI